LAIGYRRLSAILAIGYRLLAHARHWLSAIAPLRAIMPTAVCHYPATHYAMKTMATSTAATNPPQCPPTTNTTDKASNTWRESNASKYGTLGIDSSCFTNQASLREIPTRIPRAAPAAAVVDLRVDDNDRYNIPSTSSIYPSWEAPNRAPPLTTLHDDKNACDYQSSLAATNAAIAKMKQRWPPMTADAARFPTPIQPDLSSKSDADHRNPTLSPLPPTTNDPIDYQSDLAAITAKIEQWKRRWTPATLKAAVAISITDAKPQSLIGHPRDIVTPESDATKHQHTAPSPYSTIDTDGLRATTTADEANPADADAGRMKQSTLTNPSVAPPSSDADLLCTVQSLDDFLVKYPRPIDSRDDDDPPQPHTTSLPPTCFQAMFHQQTEVISTINVLITAICHNLPQILDALSRCIHPVAMKPKLHPQSPHTTIPLQKSQYATRPPHHPQSCPLRVPASKTLLFQNHKSVKPPKPWVNRGTLAPTWAKDSLYPP